MKPSHLTICQQISRLGKEATKSSTKNGLHPFRENDSAQPVFSDYKTRDVALSKLPQMPGSAIPAMLVKRR